MPADDKGEDQVSQVAQAQPSQAAPSPRPKPRTATAPRKSLDQLVDEFLAPNPDVPVPMVLQDTPETIDGLKALASVGAWNYLIKTAEKMAKAESGASDLSAWLQIKVRAFTPCGYLYSSLYVFFADASYHIVDEASAPQGSGFAITCARQS
jgi:hypothetical protein